MDAKAGKPSSGRIAAAKSGTSKRTKADIFNDPKNPVCVRNVTRSGRLYFVSRGLHGGSFRLWHDTGNGYALMAEAGSPVGFDELIPWDD